MDRFYLFVMLAGIISGTIVFGGGVFSGLGLSAYEISLFTLIPSIVILLPFILLRKKLRASKKLLPLLVLFGLVTAVIIITQFIPVVLGVPVAMVVLLLYTQPAWTLLFTKLFLKEKITKIKVISAVLVLLGVAILVNPFSIDLRQNFAGIAIALVAGIALSGWIILGSVASKSRSHIITTNFYEVLFSAIFILLSLPVVRLFVADPKITSLSLSHPLPLMIGILMFGVLANLINHLFYFEGVKKVPTMDAGIIMLLEPVVGAILSAVFLKQAITIYLIIGGALILLANYLVIAKGSAAPKKHSEKQ